MKLLIDNALSPQVAAGLAAAGEDALHVRDIGLQHAEDKVILEAARTRGRTLVSADADFGTLLTLSQALSPSVIQFRHGAPKTPSAQVELLLAHLPDLAEDIQAGCLATIELTRIRVRRLPIR